MTADEGLLGRVVGTIGRRAAELEEVLKARMEVDVRGLYAGVRGRLEQRLTLTPITVPGDLSERPGPMGWGTVSTSAWSAPRFRKIALSHVAFSPIIEGFALVVLPEEELAAPVFAADFMALPSRLSIHAETYGAAELREPAQAALAPLAESFARLSSTAGPERTAHLASGLGLNAKVSLRMVDDGFAALLGALLRYLDVVTTAPEGPGGPATQREFARLFREPNMRSRALAQLLGESWWQSYSALLFE